MLSVDAKISVDIESIDYGYASLCLSWIDPIGIPTSLSIDFDGFCSREMVMRSGQGPPIFKDVYNDGMTLEFTAELAKRLELDEVVKVSFECDETTFANLKIFLDSVTDAPIKRKANMSIRSIRQIRALLVLGLVAFILMSAFVRADDEPTTQQSVKTLQEIEQVYPEEVNQLRLEFDARLTAIHERRLADLEAARKQAMLDDNLDLANLIRSKIDEAKKGGPTLLLGMTPPIASDPETSASDESTTAVKSVAFIIDASNFDQFFDKRKDLRLVLTEMFKRFGPDTDVAVILVAADFQPVTKFIRLTTENRDQLLESVTNTRFSRVEDPTKQINNAFQLKPEQIWYLGTCAFKGNMEKYANQIKRLKQTYPDTTLSVALVGKSSDKERDAANRLAREGGGMVED